MLYSTCISLPTGTNGKPLAAIARFPNAIDKLMNGKLLATNGEEITNAMIGNDILAICYKLLGEWFFEALGQIGNEWWNISTSN